MKESEKRGGSGGKSNIQIIDNYYRRKKQKKNLFGVSFTPIPT